MKAKYFVALTIAGSALLAGCKKDFLDVQPTQFTTPEQLASAAQTDPFLLQGGITGLYTTMFTPGVGGSNPLAHDDFGQKGIDIYTDLLQSDMVLGAVNYNWFSTVARYQSTIDFTQLEAYIPWRYYYRQVFGANTVIKALGGNDMVPDNEIEKGTMGQAKAMRAYAYFYLSQLYAREYGTGNEKILPLYTLPYPEQFNLPKSTTSEVWNQMVEDLTQAISLLEGFTRTSKDQVDRDVARGLLAYVLAARGTPQDWTQVESLTQEIMAAYPKTTAAQVVFNGTNLASAGFNNVATPSWMWGVDLTLAQGIDLVSWWGQVDIFTYSYAWAGDPKVMDISLYQQIRTDDIRRAQFRSPTAAIYQLAPWNKFFDPGRSAGGQRQVTTDLLYMRADEFYLLNAEAKARLGRDAEARTVLSNYLAERITDVSYLNALSGQALLNEIYLQTRIELWGEGKAYLAMKRNKATIVRGSNHLYEAGNSIPYNDPKVTFVIPQPEVLNNPNLNK